MLLNYLKITLKVLGRNPFFTFVSMFGIVFTLVVLLVLSAFIDHLVAPHYPEVNRDRSLYVGYLRCLNEAEGGAMMGPPSYHFLRQYVKSMKTPERVAIASFPSYANAYAGNRRLKLNVKFTDEEFWQVTAFDFLEGKAFYRENIDNGDYVAVINERTRDNYFGKGIRAAGQAIVVENVTYRVIGVVKDVPITRPMVAADVYLPYNVSKSQTGGTGLVGSFIGILLAESKADFPKIREEFQHNVAKINLPLVENGFTFNVIEARAGNYLENFLTMFLPTENATVLFYLAIGIFMLLFMMLPAINLVNLNVGRIMERSSEIGIRKAFGASTGKLVTQFLLENLFITLLGGAIAVAAAFMLLQLFNQSGLIPGADLSINIRVLLAGLAVCLVFGMLSGVVPAIRMSRMHVIDALHGGDGKD